MDSVLNAGDAEGDADGPASDQASKEMVFRRDRVNRAWYPVDLVFLFLSCVCAVLWGVSLSTRTTFNLEGFPENEGPSSRDNDAWMPVEITFCVLFLLEDWFRYLIWVQFEKHNDLELNWGLFPKWGYACASTVLLPCELVHFCKEEFLTMMDVIICIFSLAGNAAFLPHRLGMMFSLAGNMSRSCRTDWVGRGCDGGGGSISEKFL